MADTDRLAGLRRAQGAWPVVASYVDDDADHLYSGGDDDDSDGAVLDELLTFAAVKLAFNTALAPFDTAVVLQQVQYQPLVHDADGRLVVDASQDAAATTAEAGADGTETDIVGAANTDLPALQVRADQAATVREYLPERLEPSLPVLLGTLDAVRTVARREGMLALWNGNLLQTWVDVSSIMVQPSLESALNDAFGLDDTTPFELLPPPRCPNLGTILVSHIATALVMSPIKVLRTRLIVQKSSPTRAKYLGIRHGLTTLYREEGLAGWYRGLSATLLHAVLVPLCQSVKPVILSVGLGVDRDSILYVLGDFVLSSAQLLLSFPVHTAQHRLQAEWTPIVRRGRSKDRPFDPSVRLSPIRYTGVIDCIQRIVREEGVGALYRGFLYQWTGTVLVSLLGSLARLDEDVDVEQSGDVLRGRADPRGERLRFTELA